MEQELKQSPEPSPDSELKYKIQHNRPDCIGCAACAAVAPKFWVMHEDGKSDIVDSSKRDDGWEELDIKEDDFVANKEAAESCPVNVIHIIKKDTKEQLI